MGNQTAKYLGMAKAPITKAYSAERMMGLVSASAIGIGVPLLSDLIIRSIKLLARVSLENS